MAEVEYKGIKIGGSKLLLILPLLGTIGGGLWGGFELWHRYQAMEVKIAKYVAPDMSGFDKNLAILGKRMDGLEKTTNSEVKSISNSFKSVGDKFTAELVTINTSFISLKEKMAGVIQLEEQIKQSADDARDYTKEIKRDLKNELHHMSTQLDSIEKRGKEAFRLVRESIDTNDTKVRNMITVNSDRFDKRREQLRTDMDVLETRIKSEMKELKAKIDDKIKKALENPLANMRK